MMLLGANLSSNSDILAHTLLGGHADGQWVSQSSREFGGVLPKARLITCGQIFDRFENRAMLSWLLGENGDEDVRFRLARILLDRSVQENFDLVLIDAPPRLSFGAVNALCASHGIVVPTVLDRLSADAVGRFLGRANHVFRPLNPGLEHAGVVGTMTKQKKRNEDEAKAFDMAKQGLAQWHGRSHVFDSSIPHIVALSRAAGQEIGYIGKEKSQVVPLFDALGDEISLKFGL